MISGVCAFTGHRAEKLPWKDESSKIAEDFKMRLCIEICYKINAGCNTFLTGMCNGIDIIAGEMVLELKQTFPFIELTAVIPYEEFASAWSEEWRERYFALAEKADKEIMLNTKFVPNCLRQRNKYLVDNAKHLLAVQNSGDTASGTSQTIDFAVKLNRDIVIIEPKSLKIERITGRLK